MKLNIKLFLIYCAIAAIACPLVGYFTYHDVKQNTYAEIQANIKEHIHQIDELLTQFLQSIEFDVLTISRDKRIVNSDDSKFTNFLDADEETFVYKIGPEEQEIRDFFHNYVLNHEHINSVYMGRENGTFVRSHKRARTTKYDPRMRPWYRLALTDPSKVLRTDPYRSVSTKDMNIGTVRALVDSSGKVQGVVGIDVTLKDLTDYISQIKIGKNGFCVLLDEKYSILTDVFEKNISEHIKKTIDNLTPDAKREGMFKVENLYLFYSESPYSGWTICTVFSEDEITSKIRRAIITDISRILIALVIVSSISALATRRFIVRPTQVLENSINSIVSTENLSEKIPDLGNDEIGRLAKSFQIMMGRLKQSFQDRLQLEKANSHLQRYFSPSVAEQIIHTDTDLLKPGGKEQEVVILFSDIRNFTTISEQIPPEHVMKMLSRYHHTLVEIIFKYGGTLDKFIGDGIMATFGTPVIQKDDVHRAVQAAIEMKEASPQIQEELKDITDKPIHYGIGLHVGRAIVGNIGTHERLEFTVIGDPVNVASRIESACKTFNENLLFSKAVNERVKDKFATKFVEAVELKGKAQKMKLYTIE